MRLLMTLYVVMGLQSHLITNILHHDKWLFKEYVRTLNTVTQYLSIVQHNVFILSADFKKNNNIWCNALYLLHQ